MHLKVWMFCITKHTGTVSTCMSIFHKTGTVGQFLIDFKIIVYLHFIQNSITFQIQDSPVILSHFKNSCLWEATVVHGRVWIRSCLASWPLRFFQSLRLKDTAFFFFLIMRGISQDHSQDQSTPGCTILSYLLPHIQHSAHGHSSLSPARGQAETVLGTPVPTSLGFS